MKTIAAVTLGTALLAAPAAAAPVPFEPLRAGDYQSFVGNWEGSAPLCVAISSAAEWDAVIHPAAVMGAHRPYAPPAAFWRDRTLLLIARVGAPGPGGVDGTLRISGVESRRGRIEVATLFSQAPSANYTAKLWVGAVVRRPLASRTVAFTESGRILCTVSLTPAQQGARGRRR